MERSGWAGRQDTVGGGRGVAGIQGSSAMVSLALSLNLSLAATFEEYQMKRRHSVHEVVCVPT